MHMWQFIPLSDFIKDLASDPEPEKGMVRHIWDHYFSRKKAIENSEVEFVSPELQSAPTRLLDWVAPPPKWQTACGPQAENAETGTASTASNDSAGEQICCQLSQALQEWQSARVDGPGIHMILAPPHSGIEDMVRGWAQSQEYFVAVAPTSEQIWDANSVWLDDLKRQLVNLAENGQRKARLVLVGLEDYYIRHHNGLNFLRKLMDYLTTEAPPSLVVCNSWAWIYLRDALHIDAMVRPPLTLARSSGETLAAWLTELSGGSHYRTFTFRQGQRILFTIGDEPAGEVDADAYLALCDKLADLSRGNPGVARALWRRSISIEATVDIHEQVQREAKDDPGYTIWVQPIDDSMLPAVPSTFTNNDAFILQTLLIHNGLSRPLLHDALPLSASRISRRLQVMLNAELVRQRTDLEGIELLEVSPLGYLSVRTFLREQGFFVDDL